MENKIDPKEYGVTSELFKEWRTPKFGIKNPQKIESMVWKWLFHSKLSGYESTKEMSGPSPFDVGPTLSYDRFGQTSTKLPDGRTIFVGGEHEDHYDPDFCIYNDVVVEYPNGEVEFYCYPESEFQPTDFHSATLVGDNIVIIGSLGYSKKRIINKTQVYLLNTVDFQIVKMECGGDSPGWIHSHNAILNTDKKSITVKNGLVDVGSEFPLRENIDDWKLDIDTWTWESLTKREWPRWELSRKDKFKNHIYDIRQVLWSHEVNWKELHDEDMRKLEKSMGFKVDFNLVKNLYEFSFAHENVEKDDEKFNVYWIYVDGVRVRFVEERYCLNVTVEGRLSSETLISIKEQLLLKLNELERTEWLLNEY